ncbi:hypothetical protein B0A48_16564 [Cryoendolithus antarcticus]|uniref:AA9 family lytic polysaccharide monooxygenase n=1 Tax=Cryoendolithus antarcticus TaxID=1507870 RepID=A0A1V8SE38_9PEZI|nr:hypothetical protein B0A48_16564 [Cryoendolithus antarcticus]
MKATFFTLAAALAVREVAAHATFQDLWVNGVDQGQQCVRLPQSNSPLQDVTSNNIRCNANIGAVSGRCAVAAGDTVSIEMHQQGGDRGCGSEAIGGAHYGPVHAYLSKVSDARTADGSSGFFKIFANTWAPAKNGAADNDYWGTKELNNCCGKMDVTIPSDIPAGDYLLRAEVIALHVASGLNGAQFYVSCYQITVSGGGSASPATVTFPGAYKNTDPGIYIDIHNSISTYIDPGPTVYAGGVSRAPLATGCTGYAAKETPTKSVVQPTVYTPGQGGASTTSAAATTSAAGPTTTGKTSTTTTGRTSTPPPTTLKTTTTTSKAATSSAGGGSCSVAKYAQCGGTGWTGCTTCASGSTCTGSGYYYQCL